MAKQKTAISKIDQFLRVQSAIKAMPKLIERYENRSEDEDEDEDDETEAPENNAEELREEPAKTAPKNNRKPGA